MTFAEKLKTARLSAGLTQVEMAELTLIPKRSIENWEAENRIPPEYLQRYVLADLERLRKTKNSGQPVQAVYPVILTQTATGYTVFVPDFNINTHGDSRFDAMGMARDAIGLMGIDMQDDGEPLPEASTLAEVEANAEPGTVTLVDIDFTEYRRKNDAEDIARKRAAAGGHI